MVRDNKCAIVGLRPSTPSRKTAANHAALSRHTAITNVGRHADVRIRQRFARHENILTTMRYQTLEDEQVHQAAERANRNWKQRDIPNDD